MLRSLFEADFEHPVQRGLVASAKFDGENFAIAGGTRDGKVLVKQLTFGPEGNVGIARIEKFNIGHNILSLMSGDLKKQGRDLLFIGTQSEVIALDVASNSRAFVADADDGAFTFALSHSEEAGSLLVAGGACTVLAWDAEGEEKYWGITGDDVLCIAVGQRGVLNVFSVDGFLRTFDQEELLFETRIGSSATHALALGDSLVLALADGSLTMREQNGSTEIWTYGLGSQAVGLLLVKRCLIVATVAGSFMFVDPASGKLLDSIELPGEPAGIQPGPVFASGPTVVVFLLDGRVFGVGFPREWPAAQPKEAARVVAEKRRVRDARKQLTALHRGRPVLGFSTAGLLKQWGVSPQALTAALEVNTSLTPTARALRFEIGFQNPSRHMPLALLGCYVHLSEEEVSFFAPPPDDEDGMLVASAKSGGWAEVGPVEKAAVEGARGVKEVSDGVPHDARPEVQQAWLDQSERIAEHLEATRAFRESGLRLGLRLPQSPTDFRAGAPRVTFALRPPDGYIDRGHPSVRISALVGALSGDELPQTVTVSTEVAVPRLPLLQHLPRFDPEVCSEALPDSSLTLGGCRNPQAAVVWLSDLLRISVDALLDGKRVGDGKIPHALTLGFVDCGSEAGTLFCDAAGGSRLVVASIDGDALTVHADRPAVLADVARAFKETFPETFPKLRLGSVAQRYLESLLAEATQIHAFQARDGGGARAEQQDLRAAFVALENSRSLGEWGLMAWKLRELSVASVAVMTEHTKKRIAAARLSRRLKEVNDVIQAAAAIAMPARRNALIAALRQSFKNAQTDQFLRAFQAL